MDSIKFYSTITPSLKRKMLFRGTFLAGIGILLLSYAGVFLSPAILNVWGIPVLGLSIGLIAWGMIPYRQLCRLENDPDVLTIDERGLTLVRRGKALYMIPLTSIEKMEYVEKGTLYGIGIQLKESIPEKIVIYDPGFNMQKHQDTMRRHMGYPIFIANFSRRTYVQLQLLD